MPDYKNMTAKEAVREAWELSSCTSCVAAERAGVPHSTFKRYLERDSYLPGIDKAPDLCRAFGNRVILDWIEAQLEPEPESTPARSRAEVLTDIARASMALSDVQRVLVETESSGIGPHHARQLRSHLNDVIRECQDVKARLGHIASKQSIADCDPLASLRDQEESLWLRVLRGIPGT